MGYSIALLKIKWLAWSGKGKRCVNKISSAECDINIRLVSAVNNSGYFSLTVLMFPRKRLKAKLLDGAPLSAVGLASETINRSLFFDWLSHFKD